MPLSSQTLIFVCWLPMQFPAVRPLPVKARQVRHGEQFFTAKKQRQSATHEARHRALIEQTLEITMTAIRQMHHLAALPIADLQRPGRSLADEHDTSVIGQA